jgi:hypothetical protein
VTNALPKAGVSIDPDTLLTTEQAAELLSFDKRTLDAWRSRGSGPDFVRVSARAIRYRRCDLIFWIEQLLTEPTTDDHVVEAGLGS